MTQIACEKVMNQELPATRWSKEASALHTTISRVAHEAIQGQSVAPLSKNRLLEKGAGSTLKQPSLRPLVERALGKKRSAGVFELFRSNKKNSSKSQDPSITVCADCDTQKHALNSPRKRQGFLQQKTPPPHSPIAQEQMAALKREISPEDADLLPEAPVQAPPLPHQQATATGDKSGAPAKEVSLMKKTIDVFTQQIDAVEGMIRQYLHELQLRNERISQLDDIKQRLRIAGGKIEWKKDPELKALVEQAEMLGVKIPTSDIWDEKEKAILKENIDDVKTSLTHANEMANFKLTHNQNMMKTLWELVSDLVKVLSNIAEHFARNLPTR